MIIWYCGATKQHQRLNWVPTATHQPRPMWRGSWWVTKRAPEANWRPWCSDGSLRMVVRREERGGSDSPWLKKCPIIFEGVSHHVWRSVLEARTILEECGSLWRYWREELRQQQEDGQDLWMDDLDKYNFWLEPPDDVSGQRPTGLGWWSPHYQRERTRSKL